VFVAGPPGHGYGAHEHNAGCRLLAESLNASGLNVRAAVYENGWPDDPSPLKDADAVVVFSDGDKKSVVVDSHIEELDRLAKKGVGIAFLHFALIPPTEEARPYWLDWIGGYYEPFWSVNPIWKADFLQFPEHPVTRGVEPFDIADEWYYNMRFPENMRGVTPLLTAVPPDATRTRKDGMHSGNPHVRVRLGEPEHVAWVFERPGGGRGFGITGAHWHWNWANDNFRKLTLNALVWIAGVEPPPSGVVSRTPLLEELEQGLDMPQPKKWDREKIRQKIEEWTAPDRAGSISKNEQRGP